MRIILIIITVFWTSTLVAQEPYQMQDTIKGKNASYYWIKIDQYQIIARNIHNVDTSRDMYFDNGEMVPGARDLEGRLKFDKATLLSTAKEILTPEEWNRLENANVGYLKIWIVADKTGDPLEIDFTFRNNDPVFAIMSPERLFQLEEKLKKILKMEVAENDRNIKKLKYSVSLQYRYLKN